MSRIGRTPAAYPRSLTHRERPAQIRWRSAASSPALAHPGEAITYEPRPGPPLRPYRRARLALCRTARSVIRPPIASVTVSPVRKDAHARVDLLAGEHRLGLLELQDREVRGADAYRVEIAHTQRVSQPVRLRTSRRSNALRRSSAAGAPEGERPLGRFSLRRRGVHDISTNARQVVRVHSIR